jgi:hypothetical protein
MNKVYSLSLKGLWSKQGKKGREVTTENKHITIATVTVQSEKQNQ